MLRIASPQTSPVPAASRSELAKLTGEIAWYEEQGRKTVALALQYKLEIGRRLARAKQLLPHGAFLNWAREEFGWTARHVQRHLTLAANATRVTHLPPDTSLRVALAIIGGGQGKHLTDSKSSSSARDSRVIRVIGLIDSTDLDRDRFLEGVAKLAAELGARKMQWKISEVKSRNRRRPNVLDEEPWNADRLLEARSPQRKV